MIKKTTMITAQTCGDTCWHAREDICHCSCGGRNHGCLRSADGEQPLRTSKIKGAMYQLVAVQDVNGNLNTLYDLMHNFHNYLIEQKIITFGDINWAEGYRLEHFPSLVRIAPSGNIERWPELAAWRDGCEYKQWSEKPECLWINCDYLKYWEEMKNSNGK